jgi:hypothetical protein
MKKKATEAAVAGFDLSEIEIPKVEFEVAEFEIPKYDFELPEIEVADLGLSVEAPLSIGDTATATAEASLPE